MKTTQFLTLMVVMIMMSTIQVKADNWRKRGYKYGNRYYNRQEIYFNSQTGHLEDRIRVLEDRLSDVEYRQDIQDYRTDRIERLQDRMDYRQDRIERLQDRMDYYQGCYDIRGYEDRVYYRNRRWNYLRNGRWYSYDYYIQPTYYYSCPISTFGKAIVSAAVVGTIINALVR